MSWTTTTGERIMQIMEAPKTVGFELILGSSSVCE